jgi:hypothetical protein
MRNRYPGICYYCEHPVAAGEGHFERYRGGWRTIHANCVFKQRAEKQVSKDKITERWAMIDGSQSKGAEIQE